MAIYFEFGNGEQLQVASNVGWGDVRRTIEIQDIEGLKGLVGTGEADSVSEILEHFANLNSPDESTQKTIDGIVDILVDHEDHDDSVVVTDGMGPDDGETA